jgi:membrane-associated phospholipid phosphatase
VRPGVAFATAAVLLLAGCAAPSLRWFEEPPRPLAGEESAPLDAERTPHGSVGEFFDFHFSGETWSRNVGEGYFGTSDVVAPLALGGAALVARPFDQRGVETLAGRWGDQPSIGDTTAAVVIGGTLLLGIVAPGEGRTAGDETWTQAEAYGLSLGVATLLKATVPRNRPDDTGNSFPSGHATAAFTAATLAWRNSGPWAGVPAYGLAAATAFSRVEAGRHFPSDVLAGAALGVLCAGVVDALHFAGPDSGAGGGGSRAAPWITPLPGGVAGGLEIDF